MDLIGISELSWTSTGYSEPAKNQGHGENQLFMHFGTLFNVLPSLLEEHNFACYCMCFGEIWVLH